jgi:hypothetical protein
MSHWETMWTFHTPNFSVSWQITPDDDCDLSWDETGETTEKVNDGTYQCFLSRIVVYFKGLDVGNSYLGGSIYENPAEFRDHIGTKGKYGSYFRDMVREAITEARRTVGKMQSVRLRAA